MSDLPPPGGPSSPSPEPPPVFASYPRPGFLPTHGDPERLRALADGYFGLNWVFVANVVWAVGVNVLIALVGERDYAGPLYLGLILATVLLIGGLSYPQNKKIASGLGWAPSAATVASLLMGLNAAVCCGLIGYVVVQQIAAAEMKRYGVKGGFFGIRRRDVEARIAQMQAPSPGAEPPGYAR